MTEGRAQYTESDEKPLEPDIQYDFKTRKCWQSRASPWYGSQYMGNTDFQQIELLERICDSDQDVYSIISVNPFRPL